jgi:hypothetical protein
MADAITSTLLKGMKRHSERETFSSLKQFFCTVDETITATLAPPLWGLSQRVKSYNKATS